MQFADVDRIDWVGEQTQHRGGGYVMKTLLQGDESTPENYWLFIAKGNASYTSPRHRHNFDQFRFVLEGRTNVAPRQNIQAGEIGYFPEGVAYGPQAEDVENVMMMIQFGAGESGYLSPTTLKRAYSELAPRGTFEGGVFRCADGRKNQDAFEALWEHVVGRPVSYAAPRYAAPLVMKAESFQWIGLGDGITGKSLGTFSERKLGLDMIRLTPGTEWSAAASRGVVLVFVCSGTGHFAGNPYEAWCAAEISIGETAQVVARETTELLVMTFPPIPQAADDTETALRMDDSDDSDFSAEPFRKSIFWITKD